MNKKLISIIPVVLFIGLAFSGIAYAHWRETLYINANIESDDLKWEWYLAISGDPEEQNDWHCGNGFMDPAPYPGDQHVATTTAEIDDEDPHIVDIIIDNAYPSYYVEVSCYPMCTGSVPIIVEKVLIDDQEFTENFYAQLDLNDDGLADVEIAWGDNFGVQIDPWDTPPFPEISLWIHVLQEAPEDTQGLTFSFEIVGVQYNLYEPDWPFDPWE
jgi:hypothetical protein